jgi:hypothetical protein
MNEQVQPISTATANNISMMELEIESRVEQTLPNGVIAHIGKSVIKVFANELPQILAMVEPEINWQERARAEDAATLKAAIEQDPNNAEYIERTWAGSLSAAFRRLYHRDLLPLVSVVKLRENLPPPQIEGQYNVGDAVARAIELGINKAIERFTAPTATQHQPAKAR